MREILFRGKRINNGEWVEGFYLYTKENTHPVIIDMKCCSNIIDPETVGEYTGMTDKNGTKIFEGDILQFDYIGRNLGVNGVADVIFKSGKFGVLWGTHKELIWLDGFANTTKEVIGNIHDNPELLKECDI